MNKLPVRGMRDILPSDAERRDFLLKIIAKHARQAGFQKIETPALEHVENLTGKIGGENEKLIFRVLERGHDFESALADVVTGVPSGLAPDVAEDLLATTALRYDLTVPLARYFVANGSSLTLPFKAFQIGSVWRADAPQKGRYREFLQCDFDIIGDGSILAEIDCVRTVAATLWEICTDAGITGLTIRLNDRRLLTGACATAGFSEAEMPAVLITLDKQDKIGRAGVQNELLHRGFPATKIEQFLGLFAENSGTATTRADSGEEILESFANNANTFGGSPDAGGDGAVFADALYSFASKLAVASAVTENLENIARAVRAVSPVRLVFDPSLVRGMGYYTGPIFEVAADGLTASIGGGGRYDGMIGRFSGQNVPACGFSIGFERLAEILKNKNFVPERTGEKIAVLVSKKVTPEHYEAVLRRAESLRSGDTVVSVLPMAHNLGRQIARLEADGFTKVEKIYAEKPAGDSES